MGQLTWLSQKGDETIEWDPRDETSTQRAKDKFAELKKQGFEFFEVTDAKGKRLKRWDKKLGKIIASPGVQTRAEKQEGKRSRAMAGGPNRLSA